MQVDVVAEQLPDGLIHFAAGLVEVAQLRLADHGCVREGVRMVYVIIIYIALLFQ